MIRVFVVDDHHLFREGLIKVLNDASGLSVVGSACDGEQALEQMAEFARRGKALPDVILMELNLLRLNGLETARLLHARYPELQILVLTVSDRSDDLFAAIRAGARGYLLKDTSSRELLEAIEHLHAGEAVIAPSMAGCLLDEFVRISGNERRAEEAAADLTGRERQVLQGVAGGLSNKEIGARLELSPHTVKSHLHSILDKLHLRNRSEAAAWAVHHGLVGRPDGN